MSIAEKLTQIAENEQKVYDAGLFRGFNRGYEDGYSEGYPQGKADEYDRFWDAFQENGNKQSYNYAFAGDGWSDETYGTIKYDFGQPKSVASMFRYNSKVTDTVKELDFYNVGTISATFDNATALKKIRCLKVVSWNTFASTVFQKCSALEEIEFSGELATNGLNLSWSPLLSHESLMSIINVLADKSGDTSQTWTVTLGEANLAKLTDEEKAIAQNKGWTLA